MPVKDLGESAKKLALSALTEVLGHKLTLNDWEETGREEKEVVFLVPDDGREIVCRSKQGACVGFNAVAVTRSDEQVPVSGCCIFKIPKRTNDDYSPNSIWLEVGVNEEKHDFYAPSESDLFRREGVPKT